jgi:hypothetical protein
MESGEQWRGEERKKLGNPSWFCPANLILIPT